MAGIRGQWNRRGWVQRWAVAAALVAGSAVAVVPGGRAAAAPTADTISHIYSDPNGHAVDGLDWSKGQLYVAASDNAQYGARGTICSLPDGGTTCSDIPLEDAGGNLSYGPWDVKMGPDGYLYFTSTDGDAGTVDRIDPATAGATVQQVAASYTDTSHNQQGLHLGGGGWLAFDGSGRLYLTQSALNYGDQPLVVIDTSTLAASAVPNSTVTGSSGAAQAVTVAGNDLYTSAENASGLYRTGLAAGGVTEVDNANGGNPVEGAAVNTINFFLAGAITSDAAGNLFIAANISGGEIWEVYGPNAGAQAGTVHLVAGGGSTALSSAPDGTSATAVQLPYPIAKSGFYAYQPAALAVDDAGNLYYGVNGDVYEIYGVAASSHTLTTTVASGAGYDTGTVTDGSGSQICTSAGTPCSATYPDGTALTLTATPDVAGDGVTWTGCDSVSADRTRCSLTVTSDRSVTVAFSRVVRPSSAYATGVLGDGAVAYYRLDEGSGTLAADSTGNGANGTYQAAATQGVAGALSSEADAAVSGNGTGPVVTAPDTNLPVTPGSYDSSPPETVELWFNLPASDTGQQGLLTYGAIGSGPSGNGFSLEIYGGTYVVVYEGGSSLVSLPASVYDGQWHLLDVTQAGGTNPAPFTTYLDGQAVGTGNSSAPVYRAGTSGLMVGAASRDGGSTFYYAHGSIDEVAVYPTALTAAQIQARYTAGTAVAPGAPTAVQASLSGSSVDLSWTAPSAGSSPLASYTVTPSPACPSCTGLQVPGSGGTPPATTTIGGLAAGTTYTFTVTASSAVGSGPASSASNPVTVPMSHQLTAAIYSADGTATGSVASADGAISCPGTCTESVPYSGATPGTVQLTATPGAGSYLSGWNGCADDSQVTCSVTVGSDSTVTASFLTCPAGDTCYPFTGPVPSHQLTTAIYSADGTGTGRVTSSDGHISCPGTCTESVSYSGATPGTVQLTATPGAGSYLSGWNGCADDSQVTCSVTLSSDTTVTASFLTCPTGATCEPLTGPQLHTLTVGPTADSTGSGLITSTTPNSSIYCGDTHTACSEPVYYQGGQPGTETLDALPDPGSSFAGWTGCIDDTQPSCSVTLDQDRTVQARFTLNSYTLSVNFSGAGSGVVDSGGAGTPAPIECATDTITGPTICGALFPYGTSVTLTATPAAGSTVANWSRCDSRTATTCTITVTADSAETVSFGVQPPTVSAVSPDYGTDTTRPVDITGTGFTTADQVLFGTNPAAFTVRSDTSIQAYPPAASDQMVAVTVHNPGGTSPTSSADHYSYTDIPPDIPVSRVVSAPNLDTSDFTFNGTVNGQDVHITVPEGALPAGTNFYIYAVGSDPAAQQQLAGLLPASARLDGAFGLSWIAPDGTTPTPPSTEPVVFTVSAPGLASGSSVFQSTPNGLLGLDPVHLYVFAPGNAVYDPHGDTFTGTIGGASRVIAAGGGNIFMVPGGNVIAAGGGNVITAGGGNVIAAGGGNVIAAGSGNLVLSTAAGLVAHGDGTLFSASNGFVPQPFTGANGVIAAGGGNVIAAGGGNLFPDAASLANITAAYNSLISQAANGVIAAGGGNLTSGANGAGLLALNTSQLYAGNLGSFTVASFGDPLLLAAATAPAAPSTVTASGSTNSVTVQWTAALDGGSPVTSYTVTSHPSGAVGAAGDKVITVNPPPGQASFDPTDSSLLSGQLTGLTAGPYQITVTATNAQGTGPASAPVQANVSGPATGGGPGSTSPTTAPPVTTPPGSSPPTTAPPTTTPPARVPPPPAPAGYRLIGGDGGVFDFGGSGFYGSLAGQPGHAPAAASVPTPDGSGYWIVTRSGAVSGFGAARFYGDRSGAALAPPIVGMAATPDGRGYWLVASDGGVFAFGDAGFDGSAGGLHLAAPIVGMAATPDGRGYWLVASDGGVFAFGDATFGGSTGGLPLVAPVVGMAATLDGRGYWLVASDGGVFAFGDAGFAGSTGGIRLAGPIIGISAA